MKFLRQLNRMVTHLPPARAVIVGYGAYICVVFLLLCLPFAHTSQVGVIDNLFIAVSAVSTTGLVTVNTPEAYTFFGQFIILLGFQAGGLGYMTIGSFILLASSHHLSPSRVRLGRAVFGLPESFHLPTFIRRIVIYAVVIELAGALLLWKFFSDRGVEDAVWSAIFHSVSAFCTAGFSVFPNSLEDFRGHGGVNAVISVLSLAGAIGFLVVNDVFEFIARRKKRFTLTTKIILISTFGMSLLGALFYYFFDNSISSLPMAERRLTAWFQSMSSLTTVGFNTHPQAVLSPALVLMTTFLMILGASPCGTGGGLKSTTWSAAIAVLINSLTKKGDCEKIYAFGREIPRSRIMTSFAAIVLYLVFFIIGGFALLLIESELAFEDLLFEHASALGTVGLSRGITGELTTWGKLILIVTMFVGRTGPVTIGVALLSELKKGGNDNAPKEPEDLIL